MREVGHWMVKFTTDDRSYIAMDTVDERARNKLAIVDNKIYCPEPNKMHFRRYFDDAIHRIICRLRNAI